MASTPTEYQKLSERTAITAPDGTGIVWVNQGGVSYQCTIANLSKGISLANLGITASTTELNYVDGVTSAIQTQLDAKAPTASPTFTGTVTFPTGLTGVLRADSGVVSVDSDVTDLVSAADLTTAGKIEVATAGEINTGTDAGRAVSPDTLAGSNYGKRFLSFPLFASDTSVATGDGTYGVPITSEFNGWNVVGCQANVYAQGVTGTTDIQVRKQRGSSDIDVLSTKVTIGAEYFAADGVINASNDDLATGDMIFVDVDAVHSGTAPMGLSVVVIIQLP